MDPLWTPDGEASLKSFLTAKVAIRISFIDKWYPHT